MRRSDLDDVRREVGRRADLGYVGASRDQPLPREKAHRELLVLARGAHRDGERLAVDADLERLLDRELVALALAARHPLDPRLVHVTVECPVQTSTCSRSKR